MVLKIACNIENEYQTMTLSNIGIINMPDIYKNILIILVYLQAHLKYKCVCVLMMIKWLLAFHQKFVNSEIEKNFFKFLSKVGIDVIINTNDYGDYDE